MILQISHLTGWGNPEPQALQVWLMLSYGRHCACPPFSFSTVLLLIQFFFHWPYSPQLCLEFSHWSVVFCAVTTSSSYFCVIFIIFAQMYIFTTQFSSALSGSLLCPGITTLSNFNQSRTLLYFLILPLPHYSSIYLCFGVSAITI